MVRFTWRALQKILIPGMDSFFPNLHRDLEFLGGEPGDLLFKLPGGSVQLARI